MITKYKIFVISFCLFIFLLPHARSQHIDIGVLGGVSTYQGDISPLNWKVSTGQLYGAYGAFVRMNVLPATAAKFHMLSARISGQDKNSVDESRVSRNLSFRSQIFEIGGALEVILTDFSPFTRRSPLKPYVTIGYNIFHFNPKAKYNGEWIELQPLGTEGQGIPNYPEKKKYKRIQGNLSFGFGLYYNITKKWIFGMEVAPRATTTDYLDDISTTYASSELLELYYGEMSAILANRSLPSNDVSPNAFGPGAPRGNSDHNDWYIVSSISIMYRIFYPKFDRVKRKKFKGGSKCFKF